jgi:DNA-binding winged helix-turn-helix (wHTH) protein
MRHARCSPDTVRRRIHLPIGVPESPEKALKKYVFALKLCESRRITRTPRGEALVNQAFPIALPRRVLLPGFEIDLARDELRTADGAHVELRPRSFAVLRLLAANAGRLVTKDEIMDKVWDDAVVTEDSLTQCIADIRRAIADDERRIVRTIPRRGYLLVSDPDRDDSPRPVSLDLPLPPVLAPTGPAPPDRRDGIGASWGGWFSCSCWSVRA